MAKLRPWRHRMDTRLGLTEMFLGQEVMLTKVYTKGLNGTWTGGGGKLTIDITFHRNGRVRNSMPMIYVCAIISTHIHIRYIRYMCIYIRKSFPLSKRLFVVDIIISPLTWKLIHTTMKCRITTIGTTVVSLKTYSILKYMFSCQYFRIHIVCEHRRL